jgi:hypothetical protein
MRASVSFFLVLLLAVTPILQVQGQTHQQGPGTPSSSAVVPSLTADARPVVVLEPAFAPWVPMLEADTSRWGTTDSLPNLQPMPMSTPAKVGIIVGAIIVAAGLAFLALFVLSPDG